MAETSPLLLQHRSARAPGVWFPDLLARTGWWYRDARDPSNYGSLSGPRQPPPNEPPLNVSECAVRSACRSVRALSSSPSAHIVATGTGNQKHPKGASVAVNEDRLAWGAD